MALAGFLLVLLGAWAFAVALVGAKFSFSFDGTSAWNWSLRHWELSLAPGVAAAAAGILMATRSVALGRIGGLAALAAGGWLCVGPFVYPAWAAGVQQIAPVAGSDGRRALLWIGWYVGTGAVTAALAGYALGLLARRRGGPSSAEAGGVPAAWAIGPDGTLRHDDLARPAASPLGAPVSERRAEGGTAVEPPLTVAAAPADSAPPVSPPPPDAGSRRAAHRWPRPHRPHRSQRAHVPSKRAG